MAEAMMKKRVFDAVSLMAVPMMKPGVRCGRSFGTFFFRLPTETGKCTRSFKPSRRHGATTRPTCAHVPVQRRYFSESMPAFFSLPGGRTVVGARSGEMELSGAWTIVSGACVTFPFFLLLANVHLDRLQETKSEVPLHPSSLLYAPSWHQCTCVCFLFFFDVLFFNITRPPFQIL
jgi:hypothetical protein